jgi:ubiquinone/menaquinone biosynthesis C-methylase UbiE
MDSRQHWETIYQTRNPAAVSWFQPDPVLSLRLITEAAPDRGASILDVGGGASTLVDGLLRLGYRRVGVLDISQAALVHARRRLGPDAARVTWYAADVLALPIADASLDVWHDRAVFHFLTDAGDRERYIAQVRRVVRPGGHVLVATFAEAGPERCSGLEVVRYSAEGLHGAFGADFRLLESVEEDHVTPAGVHQAFVYCLCRR